MKHFQRIVDGLDVSPIMAELNRNSDLWGQIKLRKQGPHRGMEDIWIRYNAPENFGPDFNAEHTPVWYPAEARLPSIRPLLFDLMAAVEGEALYGVIITKIPPGERILPHKDKSWHVEYTDKFYLSLQSAPGAVFGCNAEDVTEELEPKTGEIWRFDNKKLHWVENNSPVDRITLIACIHTEFFNAR